MNGKGRETNLFKSMSRNKKNQNFVSSIRKKCFYPNYNVKEAQGKKENTTQSDLPMTISLVVHKFCRYKHKMNGSLPPEVTNHLPLKNML